MRYLSIHENYYECKEFLFQNGFIDENELNDEDYDLWGWFEGDPDWVDIKNECGGYYRTFFAKFHKDYMYEGENVCLCTAEDDEEFDAVKAFFDETIEFKCYEPESWESFYNDHESERKYAYRGGRGYVYCLSHC